MNEEPKERKFRASYTHKFLELSLKTVQSQAEKLGVELKDPYNPTQEELQEIYMLTFENMSDPWEITANGVCKVEEI